MQGEIFMRCRLVSARCLVYTVATTLLHCINIFIPGLVSEMNHSCLITAPSVTVMLPLTAVSSPPWPSSMLCSSTLGTWTDGSFRWGQWGEATIKMFHSNTISNQVPSQERRKSNQVYVFFLMESPLNDGLNYTNKRLLLQILQRYHQIILIYGYMVTWLTIEITCFIFLADFTISSTGRWRTEWIPTLSDLTAGSPT